MKAEVRFNRLVQDARLKLKKIETLRHEIARLALEVCTIRHGGKKASGDDYYTMSDFAEAIDVKRKTLAGWVDNYKLLKKVDIHNPTPQEWNDMNKVGKHLKNENTARQALAGTKGKKEKYKDKLTKQDIQPLFRAVQSGDNHVCELNSLVKYAQHMQHLAKSMDLSRVDESTLRTALASVQVASMLLQEAIDSKATSLFHASTAVEGGAVKALN